MAQKTPDILKKIVSRKHEEIDEGIKRVPLDRMIELASNADESRGFYNALYSKISQKQSGIIAEIKKASPSKGVLKILLLSNIRSMNQERWELTVFY